MGRKKIETKLQEPRSVKEKKSRAPKVAQKKSAGKVKSKSDKNATVAQSLPFTVFDMMPIEGFDDEFTECVPTKLTASISAKIPTVAFGNIDVFASLSAPLKRNANLDIAFEQLFNRVKKEVIIRKKLIENQYANDSEEHRILTNRIKALETEIARIQKV